MEYVSDWSALPTEMLETIARFCTVMENFMAFRGVCTSWRAAAAKDVFVCVSKVPLLMLAEEDGTNEREFYSLSQRRICTRISLPDLMGKRCTGVGYGWLLTKASSGEVCLMKPFSSAARIQLPNFMEFPDYLEHQMNPAAHFINRVWLTADPSETIKFTLVVYGKKYLGFWRNGDESWTKKETMYSPVMTCCMGKVYVFDLKGRLLVWDSQDFSSKSYELVVPVKRGPTYRTYHFQDYLLGSSDGDQLLLIRRNNTCSGYVETGADRFDVFKVDLVRGELLEINDLGKDAVVCVDATEFPGVLKPNCIYFTDDCFVTYTAAYMLGHDCYGNDPQAVGKDMGIYNVGDGVHPCGYFHPFDLDDVNISGLRV